MGPVARGASRFENLLAPQKTYWPPKKLTGPYLKTKLARRKTICINLQFAHRPIIKLFRSHPRNILSNINGNPKKKKLKKKKKKKIYWPGGPVENQLLWPELARPPKKCVRASRHIANVKPWYVMTGHMSAFTNFILSYFRIPLSFQIVSSSMVAFLALPILALMSSEQLPMLVLMAPRYLKEFTLSIVSPSTSIDTFAFSYPTTISLVFRALDYSLFIHTS